MTGWSKTLVEINPESCQMQCFRLFNNAFDLLCLDRDVILKLLRSRRRASSNMWWSTTTRPESHPRIDGEVYTGIYDAHLRLLFIAGNFEWTSMRIYLRLCANGCECARVNASQQSSPNKIMDKPFELCCNIRHLLSYIVMVSTIVDKHVNLNIIIGATRRLVWNS